MGIAKVSQVNQNNYIVQNQADSPPFLPLCLLLIQIIFLFLGMVVDDIVVIFVCFKCITLFIMLTRQEISSLLLLFNAPFIFYCLACLIYLIA